MYKIYLGKYIKVWYNPKYDMVAITDSTARQMFFEDDTLMQSDIDEMMTTKGHGEAWLKRCGFCKVGEYDE